MQEQLIIFTRYPEPGKAKTRLIPALGAVGAAELYRRMTENTIAQVRALQNARPVSVWIYFTGGTFEQMQNWLGRDLNYQLQHSGDLGERLTGAFHSAFDRGAKSAIAIGTDCPELTAEILALAFSHLEQYDFSIGAATDGGYYLIGLKELIPELFQEISWSTEAVFQQTLEIAQRLKLSIAQLPTLSDVDRPEDLKRL